MQQPRQDRDGSKLVLGRNFDADGTVAQFSIKKSRQGETGKTFGAD
jgi:hypothetical protein